jgi:hypothetical protein
VVRGSQDAFRMRSTEKRCKMPNNGEKTTPLCQRMFQRVLRGDTLLPKRISGPLLDRMNLQIAVGRPRASNRSLPELGLANCKDTRVSTDSGANHPEIPDGRCCLDVEGWTKLGTWTRCAVLTKLGDHTQPSWPLSHTVDHPTPLISEAPDW